MDMTTEPPDTCEHNHVGAGCIDCHGRQCGCENTNCTGQHDAAQCVNVPLGGHTTASGPLCATCLPQMPDEFVTVLAL